MKMIIPRYVAITCLLWAVPLASLSSQTRIVGKVTDSGGAPLPFANVLLLDARDSALVKGMVTDETGQYALDKIIPGQYIAAFSMVGFQNLYSEVLNVGSHQKQIDMGASRLEEGTAQLEAVEVVGRKPLYEQKIDRMVINVENSITSAGGTALDVLEKSPGVVVDRQRGNLSMNGKSGVMVMINGKLNRMPLSAVIQMLQGMHAGNIERIELITTPPARYDAEGDAGLINIVLKKNNDYGVNGAFGLTAGYGYGEKWGANTNFNFRREKFNLYGDYAFLFDRTHQFFNNYRRVEYGGETILTDSDSERKPTQRNHNARLGFDYYISDRTVLGVLVAGYDNKWEMDAFNDISIERSLGPDTLMEVQNHEVNQWQHLMGNLNLQHRFEGNQTISLNFDYLHYYDDNPHSYTYTFLDEGGGFLKEDKTRIRKETPIDFWVGALDYTHPFNERITWEAGIKGTLSRFTNDVQVEHLLQQDWMTDPDFSGLYKLKENIGAAYSAVNMKLSDQTRLNLGLRYEHTTSNLGTVEEPDIIDRSYGNFFPSVFFSQQLAEDHKLNFSYSRRITRPNFNDLAPFVIFMDPYTFFSGNVALQPAITDGVKVDYSYKSYQLSVQYSRDIDPIARFQSTVDPASNQQFFAAENLERQRTATIMLNVPLYIGDWWEMQNSIMGTWQEVEAIIGEVPRAVDQTSFRFTSTQVFNLPKDFTLELSGFYQSATLFGTMTFQPLGTFNAGLQKVLKNDGGTLRLTVNDLFWTNQWHIEAGHPDLHYASVVDLLFEPRVVKLTYTRRFGNNKLKAARNRSTGSEAERRRVN